MSLNVRSFRLGSGGSGGSGTVTSVSVVSANGFGGTVATPTTTSAITLTTTVAATQVLVSGGTAMVGSADFTYDTPNKLFNVGFDGAKWLQIDGAGSSDTFLGDVANLLGYGVQVGVAPYMINGDNEIVVQNIEPAFGFYNNALTPNLLLGVNSATREVTLTGLANNGDGFVGVDNTGILSFKTATAATLTATQIGYGDGSNLLTGTVDLSFDVNTAGFIVGSPSTSHAGFILQPNTSTLTDIFSNGYISLNSGTLGTAWSTTPIPALSWSSGDLFATNGISNLNWLTPSQITIPYLSGKGNAVLFSDNTALLQADANFIYSNGELDILNGSGTKTVQLFNSFVGFGNIGTLNLTQDNDANVFGKFTPLNFQLANNGFTATIQPPSLSANTVVTIPQNVSGTLAISINGIVADANGDIPFQATGWGTPTGTLSRAAFDPSTVTYLQLAQTLAALQSDLLTLTALHS